MSNNSSSWQYIQVLAGNAGTANSGGAGAGGSVTITGGIGGTSTVIGKIMDWKIGEGPEPTKLLTIENPLTSAQCGKVCPPAKEIPEWKGK